MDPSDRGGFLHHICALLLLYLLSLQIALRPFPKAAVSTVDNASDAANAPDPMAHCELAATVAIYVAVVNFAFSTSYNVGPVGFRLFSACISAADPDSSDPFACAGGYTYSPCSLQVPGGDLMLWFVLYTPYVAVVYLFSYCVFH